jgi:nucleoside-diphosphate-sugar epimerase
LAAKKFTDQLVHREVIEIFGDGLMHRDFTHVDDYVQVMIEAMNQRNNASWRRESSVCP